MIFRNLFQSFVITAAMLSSFTQAATRPSEKETAEFRSHLTSLGLPSHCTQRKELMKDFQYSKDLRTETNQAHADIYDRRRDEFDIGKRDKLIKEWECQTGKDWPTHDGRSKQISETRGLDEHRYEAHHIIPLEKNGKNEWWNITPLTANQHIELHKK